MDLSGHLAVVHAQFKVVAVQANENSKMADSAEDKLVSSEKKPPAQKPGPAGESHVQAQQQHVEQHAASSNGMDDQSGSGEVGVNGYNVLESAPRRQPADVSVQAAPARPRSGRRRALYGSSQRRRHDSTFRLMQ